MSDTKCYLKPSSSVFPNIYLPDTVSELKWSVEPYQISSNFDEELGHFAVNTFVLSHEYMLVQVSPIVSADVCGERHPPSSDSCPMSACVREHMLQEMEFCFVLLLSSKVCLCPHKGNADCCFVLRTISRAASCSSKQYK